MCAVFVSDTSYVSMYSISDILILHRDEPGHVMHHSLFYLMQIPMKVFSRDSKFLKELNK